MSDTLRIVICLTLSLCCALFARSFLSACREKHYTEAFWLKGASALCFIAVGLFMIPVCSSSRFASLTLSGLILGLCGDQLLALRFVFSRRHDLMFILGAAAFAVGHGFYIAALFSVDCGILPTSLPFFLVGLLFSLLYGRRSGSHAGKLQPFAVVYIAIVVFMAAAACACAVRCFNTGLMLFALGGICFALSDNLLFAYSFGNARHFGFNIAVHIAYYTAQLLIAWSVAFV